MKIDSFFEDSEPLDENDYQSFGDNIPNESLNIRSLVIAFVPPKRIALHLDLDWFEFQSQLKDNQSIEYKEYQKAIGVLEYHVGRLLTRSDFDSKQADTLIAYLQKYIEESELQIFE